MTSVNKKDIQKQRIMRIFIDATKEIAEEEGISKITIRNVADRAGYNSATIYNYFDNVESLIAFAMIDSVTEYLHGFAHILSQDFDPIVALLLSWRIYAECSFKNPGAYAYVFNSEHTEDSLSRLETYFEIFPINEDSVNQIVTDKDMIKRNQMLYAPCFEEGYFPKDKETYIIDFFYIVHGGFSNRLFNQNIDSSAAVPLFLDYLIEFIESHLIKKDFTVPTTKEILAMSYTRQ